MTTITADIELSSLENGRSRCKIKVHVITIMNHRCHVWSLLFSSCLNVDMYSLPITQIKRLQHIQNRLARAVTRTPKHSHISPVLKSLHWLKVEQRIEYKIISITHNLLHITEPKYLHRLINIKPPSRTRSSDHLCLSLPPASTRLKFSDRSFRNSSPRLWNSI